MSSLRLGAGQSHLEAAAASGIDGAIPSVTSCSLEASLDKCPSACWAAPASTDAAGAEQLALALQRFREYQDSAVERVLLGVEASLGRQRLALLEALLPSYGLECRAAGSQRGQGEEHAEQLKLQTQPKQQQHHPQPPPPQPGLPPTGQPPVLEAQQLQEKAHSPHPESQRQQQQLQHQTASGATQTGKARVGIDPAGLWAVPNIPEGALELTGEEQNLVSVVPACGGEAPAAPGSAGPWERPAAGEAPAEEKAQGSRTSRCGTPHGRRSKGARTASDTSEPRLRFADQAHEEDSASEDSVCDTDSSLCGEAERFSEKEARARAKSMALDERDIAKLLLTQDDEASWIERFAKSNRFEVCAAVLLFSNAVVLGMQVEHKVQSGKDEVAFQIVNFVYCLFFLLELVLRSLSTTPRKFLTTGDWQWAWFDVFVVFLQILEVAVSLAALGNGGELQNFSMFGRLVRVARVVRVVRVLSLMRWCRAFRILITAIFGTLKSVGWTALLLGMIMYIFAIIFTQSVADFVTEEMVDSSQHEKLLYYYGSLPRSIFTLYKTILGGVDWEGVIEPLSDVGWVLVLLFLVYVSFVNLAVMNVVAGLFLQSAIEQAQSDEEHVITCRLKEKQQFVERLRNLFNTLNTANKDSISLREFEAHLSDEHMQAFLQTFEIENADAWTLFKLLDTDGGGSVDIKEFVEGCIRLKGTAKSIQVAELGYHDKWIMDKLIDLTDFVKSRLDPLLDRSARGSVAASIADARASAVVRAVAAGAGRSNSAPEPEKVVK